MYSKLNQQKINRLIKKYNLIQKSPFSDSYYSGEGYIGWNFKPENSYRLSDHWNFYSEGSKHCELANSDEYLQKWMLCQYKNGKYHIIIENIFTPQDLEREERCKTNYFKNEEKKRLALLKEQERKENILKNGITLLISYQVSRKSSGFFKYTTYQERCYIKGKWAYTEHGKKRVFKILEDF